MLNWDLSEVNLMTSGSSCHQLLPVLEVRAFLFQWFSKVQSNHFQYQARYVNLSLFLLDSDKQSCQISRFTLIHTLYTHTYRRVCIAMTVSINQTYLQVCKRHLLKEPSSKMEQNKLYGCESNLLTTQPYPSLNIVFN